MTHERESGMSDPVRRSPLNGFRAFLALACLAAAAAGWSATPGVLERLALTGGALTRGGA